MPSNVILTDTKGDYEPTPDPCCSKASLTSQLVLKKDWQQLGEHQAIEMQTNVEQASVDDSKF